MVRRRPSTYDIQDATTQLPRLVELAEHGEEIVIARAGVPIVRMVPVAAPLAERPLGLEQGRMVIANDFDAPLQGDELDPFGA